MVSSFIIISDMFPFYSIAILYGLLVFLFDAYKCFYQPTLHCCFGLVSFISVSLPAAFASIFYAYFTMPKLRDSIRKTVNPTGTKNPVAIIKFIAFVYVNAHIRMPQ